MNSSTALLEEPPVMSNGSAGESPAALRIIQHLCALAVAGVFIYFGGSKILGQPNDFVTAVNNYHIMPRTYANLFALALPYWEVAAGLALILPATRRTGALLIAGMLVMFIVAVGIAMYNGYDIECGCSRGGGGKAGWMTIGRNCLLLAATGLAAWRTRAARAEA